jgi:hypothetical protein
MDQQTFAKSGYGLTQNDRVLHALREHAPSWVAMPVLSRAGSADGTGFCIVHSRVADLRKLGHAIEQRSDRCGRQVLSFYRLLPSAQVEGGMQNEETGDAVASAF